MGVFSSPQRDSLLAKGFANLGKRLVSENDNEREDSNEVSYIVCRFYIFTNLRKLEETFSV